MLLVEGSCRPWSGSSLRGLLGEEGRSKAAGEWLALASAMKLVCSESEDKVGEGLCRRRSIWGETVCSSAVSSAQGLLVASDSASSMQRGPSYMAWVPDGTPHGDGLGSSSSAMPCSKEDGANSLGAKSFSGGGGRARLWSVSPGLNTVCGSMLVWTPNE